MKFLKLFSVFALIISSCQANIVFKPIISQHPLQWDWSKLENDVNNVTFDKNFGWGAATSAFQIEGVATAKGSIENNWTKAMKGQYLNQQKASKSPDRIPKLNPGCDHWNQYKQDVQLIKNTGLTDYRFSIKWSAIMPKENTFDVNAMLHYVDLVRELIKNGITPYIMLFHHEWPLWFDAKGAFEKAENNEYFVKFATFICKNLKSLLKPEEFKV